MNDLWSDLKRPVIDRGWTRDLGTFPELSIAFWRWALWKLFESDRAPGRGAVAFITNRTFLSGRPTSGLRKRLRSSFDTIFVIDMHGDVNAGTRAGITADEGVFEITVGTCITVAIASGTKPPGSDGKVYYLDCWKLGLFSRRAKLDWLNHHVTMDLSRAIEVVRGSMDDFKPIPFQDTNWPSLKEVFVFGLSGIKTQNDEALIGFTSAALYAQVAPLLVSRDDPTYEADRVVRTAFRPLDVRWMYNDPSLVKRSRPKLQSSFGTVNIVLYTGTSDIGAGPAAWCHALLPSYHSFRGDNGGYAFPLYDRRAGQNPVNLPPALLAGLTEAHGAPPTPEDVFDAILALLSATSYTLRFAEDLEDVFPHVPFPADPAVFARAVALGREIRAVETFARAPADLDRLSQLETPPSAGPLAAIGWDEGRLTLRADGTGVLAGVPRAVWDFAVSGYRVLPRWLAAREGQPVDLALVAAIRDLIARVAELLTLFDRADAVLVDTLADTLGRDELGLGAPPVQEVADDDSD